MDARDFLAIASEFRNSEKEAERRTSIGRSYYGLFNSVIATLESRGVLFHQTAQDHYTLISYLTKVRHKTARSVGAILKDLRQHRNDADYNMVFVIDSKTNDFLYQKAAKALGEFDSITLVDMQDIAEAIRSMP